MLISPDTLEYPVLCIPKDNGIYTVKNRAELESCKAMLFWKARIFDELQIVDTTGQMYVVTRAAIYKPSSKLIQSFARVLDLPIQVRLELKDYKVLPLTEVIQLVLSSITEEPELAEELSGKSMEWWRTKLNACRSIKDVLAALVEN